MNDAVLRLAVSLLITPGDAAYPGTESHSRHAYDELAYHAGPVKKKKKEKKEERDPIILRQENESEDGEGGVLHFLWNSPLACGILLVSYMSRF